MAEAKEELDFNSVWIKEEAPEQDGSEDDLLNGEDRHGNADDQQDKDNEDQIKEEDDQLSGDNMVIYPTHPVSGQGIEENDDEHCIDKVGLVDDTNLDVATTNKIDNEDEIKEEDDQLSGDDNMVIYPTHPVLSQGIEDNDEDCIDKTGVVDDTDPEWVEETSGRPRRKRNPPNPLLKCDKCDYKTPYQSTLDSHKCSHTESKLLTCEFYAYVPQSPTSMQKHIKIQDKDKQMSYSCKECEYKTNKKLNMTNHKRKHSGDLFCCSECNFKTPIKYKLVTHSKVHNKETYLCEICSYVTKYEGHIVRHKALKHNEVNEGDLNCEKCNYVTKIGWRLNIHKKKSLRKSEVKCEHCDFTTLYNCEYKMHKSTHTTQFKCSDKFTALCTPNTEFTLENAEDMDYPKRPYSPELEYDESKKFIIDTTCIDWKNVPVHKLNDPDKPYQCSKCDHRSKYKAAVRRHYERHHTDKIKPYKCINCDFSTKTKDQIHLHNVRSKSEVEIKCKTCPYTTYYKCQFAVHQRRHYPYKCSQCEYTCKSVYDVQRHNDAVHLGKTLTCEYCGFKTGRKETMAYHLTTHTGQKKYKCDRCDYSCMRPCLLTNHNKKCHPVTDKQGGVSTVDLSDNLETPSLVYFDVIRPYDDSAFDIVSE